MLNCTSVNRLTVSREKKYFVRRLFHVAVAYATYDLPTPESPMSTTCKQMSGNMRFFSRPFKFGGAP